MRKLWIALASLLLVGCAAAFVAGAALSMVGYDRRSMRTIEADARIFHLIHEQIVKDVRFRASNIQVVGFNRVVLLVGEVPDMNLKTQAARVAQQTPDVRRVYNELSVGFPTSMQQRTKDSMITSTVRSKLLTKKGLESGSIRIVTENSVVYLMGIVTEEQALMAVEVTRRVPDVAKVVKVFQYIR